MHAERGQAGLDRLLLFIVVLVAVLALLPVVLGAAGVDTGPAPTAPDADSAGELVVLGATGGNVGADSVGRVDLAVTAVGAPVPVSDITVTLLDAESVTLRPAGSGATATFGVTGADGTVDPGERAVLTVALGNTDVDGATGVGLRLPAGSEATVVVTGPNGSRTVELSVPETLAGEDVSL